MKFIQQGKFPLTRFLYITGVIGLILAIFVPITLIYKKSKSAKFLEKLEELGAVGDFIGGSSVAFLTFSSVIFLILTIVLQREELANTRRELKNSNEQYIISNHTMRMQRFEGLLLKYIDQLGKNIIQMREDKNNEIKAFKSKLFMFIKSLERKENTRLLTGYGHKEEWSDSEFLKLYNRIYENFKPKGEVYKKENKKMIEDFLKANKLSLNDIISGNISDSLKEDIVLDNYLFHILFSIKKSDIENCSDESLVELIKKLNLEEDKRVENENKKARLYVKDWLENDKTSLSVVIQTLTNILLLIEEITNIDLGDYIPIENDQETIENKIKSTIKNEKKIYFNLLKTTLNNDIKELLLYLIEFDDTLGKNQNLIDFLT